MRFLRIISFTLLLFRVSLYAETEQEKFLDSFVHYYDFTSVGRYTHEYHPFLFEKASYSLDELESAFVDGGMNLDGRIVITGYEEQAVPAYYSNYKECTGSKINDEARSSGAAGWTPQLHNKFGLMTGFLFRDINLIYKEMRKREQEFQFEHINPQFMPIFRNDELVFQKHAFGDTFPVLQQEQMAFNKFMVQGDSKAIFAELISFWKLLYENEMTSGDRKVLGTQDILFNMAHGQHLYRSSVELLKYYAGPDITYPIKITDLQKKTATFHAQTFVQKFVKNLKSIKDESTVYVFCSFVDGVGKSTLLGNVQNFQKYGKDFDKYDPVDNSSSQYSAIYDYEENICIADLPAQISHFTYKPDGMVYIDTHIDLSKDNAVAVEQYVRENKKLLVNLNSIYMASVKDIVSREGWFARSLNDPKNSEKAFLRNVLLLKREYQNKWIPFRFQDKGYIFDSTNPASIRYLTPLEAADSVGLKNSDPEQMIFFEGIRFPVNYQQFIDDLVGRLKERGVKHVVLVDFLSMYPRSSRENIRINYLLQQLAILHEDFEIDKSPYRKFSEDAELFYVIKKDREHRVLDAFRKESFIRYGLYDIMQKNIFTKIDGMKIEQVTELLEEYICDNDVNTKNFIIQKTSKKLTREMNVLERLHGRTKNFVNVQDVDFEDVLNFGYVLQKLIEDHVANPEFLSLWKEPGNLKEVSYSNGTIDEEVELDDGSRAQLLYIFSADCRDANILMPIVKSLRVCWYAMLANIVGSKRGASGKLEIEERFAVAPMWIKVLPGARIAVLRRNFVKPDYDFDEQKASKQFKLLKLSPNVAPEFGMYENRPYLLNPSLSNTTIDMFAYGCNVASKLDWPYLADDVSGRLREFRNKEKADVVLPTSELFIELEKKVRLWEDDRKNAIKQATKNSKEQKQQKDKIEKKKGKIKGLTESEQQKLNDWGKKQKDKKKSILLGSNDQIESCRFVVRALATLEMILKDVDSDVAVRRGNCEDFAAALQLIEKVTLPTYFDIIFEHNLFENYRDVDPVIQFEKWEN